MISKDYIQLLEKMAELHKQKSAGYSGEDNPDPWANFRRSELFGVPAWKGCLVRMSDKFSRLVNLVQNPDNNKCSEPIEDTLMDLSSYALICICLLEELKCQETSNELEK